MKWDQLKMNKNFMVIKVNMKQKYKSRNKMKKLAEKELKHTHT